jgi:hypothetical protein
MTPVEGSSCLYLMQRRMMPSEEETFAKLQMAQKEMTKAV